ncbi:MAG: sigma 54-interacting transcriptional regulator [Acidobacteriota bacterium]|nr:sigma 54-interacting transcriptional regulator [Acidobacteriota bacterium]
MRDEERRPTDGWPEEDPITPARFETVINSISDGVFAVDGEWRLTCFNNAAERTTGVRREDALGRSCSDVLRSNICKEACALRYTMETGRPIVNLPIHIRDEAGHRIPVTISTALLKDEDGRVIGGVETFRDLNMVKNLLRDVETTLNRDEIVTADPHLRQILEIVPTVAASDSTILIEGESGTGKGLLAKKIHSLSARSNHPLVTINCGAIPEQLLESELFGYRKGAFTGADRDKQGRVAAAEGGTLFLDEIGDLPLSLQVKVLRLIQDRVYEPLGDVQSLTADVRIVAATNRDLSKLVEKRAFRRDLYYRVNVIRLVMPPLRERPSDVPLLAETILRRLSISRGKIVDSISREAVRRLMRHDFPGNVRELQNILEHGHVLSTGREIEVEDLPDWLQADGTSQQPEEPATFADLEARFLRDVLARNSWNRTAAARELGIHKTTLHRKIRRLGIELPPIDGRSRGTDPQS